MKPCLPRVAAQPQMTSFFKPYLSPRWRYCDVMTQLDKTSQWYKNTKARNERKILSTIPKSYTNCDLSVKKTQTQNRPISQIPECICAISHNATFCDRNVHMCAHFCYKMLHCGIFVWCIVGFVRLVYWTIIQEASGSSMIPNAARRTSNKAWNSPVDYPKFSL